MNIYLQGYDYKHDVFELLRVIIKSDKINFIENKDFANKDIEDYEDRLEVKKIGPSISASLYSQGKLEKTQLERINTNYLSYYSPASLENNARKRSIYKLLVEDEERLPWGILTGIRPLKLMHGLLDKGLGLDEAKELLAEEFLLSSTKLTLMEEIVTRQRKYIYPLTNEKYNLYVNIPFCPSKCYYCSFSSYSLKNDSDKVKKYIETLIYELKETAKMLESREINTVYVGGGTPTHLKTVDLENILVTIKREFKIDEEIEFTVEAGRPDTINREKLIMMSQQGVNRISINPQTMNDTTLARIGRLHDKKSTISTYKLAKDLGFDIINMDVILGLPGENIHDIENTLNTISKLDPDNLTIHSLAVKRGSQLSKKEDIRMEEIDEVQLDKLIEKYIQDQDMYPYYLYRQKQSYSSLQNIGYSKKGKESVYNILMMEEKQTVVGVGLGAVSKIFDAESARVKRIPNFKGLGDYIDRVNENLYSKNKIINLK